MKLVAYALLLVAVGAEAKPKKPLAKGFWNVLVKPNQKWVLDDTIAKGPKITVETYDVRKVAGADVARLRFTYTAGQDEKQSLGISASGGLFDQVAVTKDGLYIMSADMDDAKVAAWLKNKASRSDPPKAYPGTKQNNGRFLTVNDDGSVCLGETNVSGEECADVCEGSMCIDPSRGVVKINGTYAPGYEDFEQ